MPKGASRTWSGSVLVPGEVGLANTTPAAALTAAFTGRSVAAVTGRGAGADDEILRRKRGDFVGRDAVVTAHQHFPAEFAEILDDVVGEAVVVVDEKQHFLFNLLILNS